MTREELIAKIENASTKSDKDFQEIIAMTIDNGFLTQRDIAREFGCSLPTVDRWKSGSHAPHYFMRKAVFDTLIKQLRQATK